MAHELRHNRPELLNDLERYANDLDKELTLGRERFRHAFCVRFGMNPDENVKASIDSTFVRFLGSDRYEQFGLRCLVTRAPTKGGLWEILMTDGVSDPMKHSWIEIWHALDLVSVSSEFRSAFPQFAEIENWMQLVYRLAWDHPNSIGGKPESRSFSDRGSPCRPTLVSLSRCRAWLSGRLKPLQGAHFISLAIDVRRCSQRAILKLIEMHSCQAAQRPREPVEPASASKPDAASNDWDDQSARALLSVFTRGLTDARFEKAKGVLGNDSFTLDEKLAKIDALIRFPPTTSAEKLGNLFGMTKQAVMKTSWWIENRKGEKKNEVGRRRAQHLERAEQYDPNPPEE